jgi:hypothetical protein
LSAYAKDVARSLSIVMDVDDVGEECLRRQKIEAVVLKLKQECKDAFRFIYKFSVEERGWNVDFALDVDPSGCLLRMADTNDYVDRPGSKQDQLRRQNQLREERIKKQMTVRLPSILELTADDLASACMAFYVEGVMNE